jgi:site-specific recombinase XerD
MCKNNIMPRRGVEQVFAKKRSDQETTEVEKGIDNSNWTVISQSWLPKSPRTADRSPTFSNLKCRVFSDETGAFTEVPAILTPDGWLLPQIEFCLAHSHDRSPAWMLKVNRSIRLFLTYVVEHPNETDSYLIFQNFAQRLYTGTYNRETGLDPSWLCWRPMSAAEARRVINHLSDWFDWLSKTRPSLAKVNPRYVGNAYDRMADEASYQFRRNRAFLGHIWKPHHEPAQSHLVRARRKPKRENENPPAFPEERFFDLLEEGFLVGARPNYRDMLITLLLNGAGFRVSEPFHLYFEDVRRDPSNPKQARVHIHHPEFGAAPEDPAWLDERGKRQTGNRRAYLAEKYGLPPRNLLLDAHSAGWKGGTHEGSGQEWYKRAYWFAPAYGELFLTLWYRYCEQVARTGPRSHPYAWINLAQRTGDMYCRMQFWRAHSRACERIGLVVGKELGTTPHGHRHAFARRLVRAGFDREMIRKFLGHISPDSQNVYTLATTKELLDALNAGAERLIQRYRRDL